MNLSLSAKIHLVSMRYASVPRHSSALKARMFLTGFVDVSS
jgi:hypothetical protein